MANNQNGAAAIVQRNAAMRAQLLATSPRQRKKIATVGAEAGQTSRIKLFNVGVVTKLLISVTAALTIGVATATASPAAPYNMIKRIQVTDYNGTDRVNMSGFMLYIVNSLRSSRLWGQNNSAAAASVLAVPNVPTAVGNANLEFMLEIPFAYDVENHILQLQDLRGAMLMQTTVGEAYLNIDWTDNLITNGNDSAVYNGAGTTTVVGNGANYITCNVWQDFLLPQAVGPAGQVALPQMDLNTVYELNGNIVTSDNIVAGQEKLIQYPNVRAVMGAYFFYTDNSLYAQTIQDFTLRVNGSTDLEENNLKTKLLDQRLRLGSDTQAGVFFNDHRMKPIETQLYGNVEMAFEPSAVTAAPSFEVGFESFYLYGSTLPGMSQVQ